MKVVARLVRTYFFGTPLTRALTLGGLASCVVALLSATYLEKPQPMTAFAWPGLLAVFLGSSLMPLMAWRLAQGHAVPLLPGGRMKLLASIYLTMAVVALPAGLLTPFALVAGTGAHLSDIDKMPGAVDYLINVAFLVYTSAVLISGWLYLIMWFLTSQRNFAGVAKALVVVALVVFVPTREIRELSATIQWNLVQLAVAWTVFGAGFLAWPRLKAKLARRSVGRRATPNHRSRDTWGREVSLILGTHNPWQLVAAFALPILLASRTGMDMPEVWLFLLTIFSTISGAFAGQAAARSRALWLRRDSSRAELFAEVEREFWRHNGIALAVLLALMAGIGSYMHLRGQLLAGGLPLLVLGSASSTYLGLMVTRGLRWTEILVGSSVMLILMAVALSLGVARVGLPAVIAVESGLAVLVFVLRAVARRRWARIDWIECRPARALATRGA